jgi:O-antigen ligase
MLLWVLLAVQAGRLLLTAPRLSGKILDTADLFALLFVGYAVARYFTAPVEYLARLELFNIFGYATIFFTCRYGIARRGHATALLILLVLVGAAVAGFAFFLRLNPDIRPFGDDLHVYYWPRLTGTYGCPNHFGGFLVMTCGVTLAFALFSHLPWLWRIICLYFAAMMMIGIIFSISRGSWIGLLCSFIVLSFFAIRSGTVRWYWPVGGFAVVVAAAVLFILSSPSMTSRINEAYTIVESNAWTRYERVQLAMDSWKIFKDYPWFGTGPATFVHVHPHYQSVSYTTLAIYTHNDYLNLLTDYGLVGLLLALGFLAAVTFKMFRYLGQRPDARDRVLLASGCAAWCALLVHSVVDFNLHIPANAMVLFALAGLALRTSTSSASAATAGFFDKQKLARVAGWGLAALAVLAGGMTIKTALGYYPALIAEQNYGRLPLATLLERAEFATRMDSRSPVALKLAGDVFRVEAAQTENPEERIKLAAESASWYERATEINPLDDTISVHLALAYDLMGRSPEAYFIYQKAIRQQPYNGYFRMLLGMHLWRRGELEKARETFEEAIHSASGTREAQAALNELNRILGVGEKPADRRAPGPAESAAPAPALAPAPAKRVEMSAVAPAPAPAAAVGGIPPYHPQPMTMTPEPSNLHEPKPGETRTEPRKTSVFSGEAGPQAKPYPVQPRPNQPVYEPHTEILP